MIGPPGSGKGTQSARLVQEFQIPHLSTGEVLREAMREETELGRAATKYMERGQLVPDDLVFHIVKERLQESDCRHGVLLDGFPRNQHQAELLQDFLDLRDTPLDLALALEVDRSELIRRMLERHRPDDTPETIAQRLEVYHAETAPVLDYYRQQNLLLTVNGMQSPDDVYQDVLQGIEPFRRQQARGRDAS
jgi:adenylate kinase